jgi:hypothetical protein
MRSRKLTAALVVIASVLAVTLASGRAIAKTAPASRCRGTVSYTNPKIAKAIASDITVDGITCNEGRREIVAFLRRKLQANERCAEAADDTYTGCRVNSFVCRGSKSLLNAQGCSHGSDYVDFRERDIALG